MKKISSTRQHPRSPMSYAKELSKIFGQHNLKEYSANDVEYEWLEGEDSRCVLIENENPGKNVRITLEYWEITLAFGAMHTHYEYSNEGFEKVISIVKGILEGELCAVSLSDLSGEWFGDCLLKKEKTDADVKEIFSSVFSHKCFYNKLTRSGYVAVFLFWSPEYDKTVKVMP